MDTQRRGTLFEQGRERAGTESFNQREPGPVVAWSAIVAGGAAAAALSLILLILGTGLGLSAVSPWAQDGISARAFGVSTIVWLTVTQILAAGMGGFLAGRLRNACSDVQPDEVFFRDSAHGFLSWAVASLATAALLASVIGGIVGRGVQTASTVSPSALAAVPAAVPGGKDGNASIDSAVDRLFRPAAATSPASADPKPAEAFVEVTRIFTQALASGALAADDVRYLGQRVAERSGLSQADAEKHVAEVYSRLQATVRSAEVKAKEAADAARKASAYAALWLFISLLIGAFVASVAAIVGGRQRDR